MTGTLKDWENWRDAWKELERQAGITLEQATIVMPAIDKKIEELKALEEVKDGE